MKHSSRRGRRVRVEDRFRETRASVAGNRVHLRVALPHQDALAKWLARRARELMDQLLRDRELSLSLVDDAQIRTLNRDWRGKDRHTDVLSFPLDAAAGPLGDVVISLDTARRQAEEGGWTIRKELSRLLAHGIAHCLGHTHGERSAALRMAKAERAMLGEAGMVGAAYFAKSPAGQPRRKRISPAHKTS